MFAEKHVTKQKTIINNFYEKGKCALMMYEK